MVEINFEFNAFDFSGICKTTQLTMCPMIGKSDGIVPMCYSRNVELAGNLIFQPGKSRKDIIIIFICNFLTFLFYSDVDHRRCGYYYGGLHDLSYSVKVHCSWYGIAPSFLSFIIFLPFFHRTQGNGHILLPIPSYSIPGNAAHHRYHPRFLPCLSSKSFCVRGNAFH